jgi:hypothetical protein
LHPADAETEKAVIARLRAESPVRCRRSIAWSLRIAATST